MRRGARGEQRRGARRDEARGEERREASGREARRDVRSQSEKNGRERRDARREETRAEASERKRARERGSRAQRKQRTVCPLYGAAQAPSWRIERAIQQELSDNWQIVTQVRRHPSTFKTKLINFAKQIIRNNRDFFEKIEKNFE